MKDLTTGRASSATTSPPSSVSPLWTASQLAELLKVPKARVYELARLGSLPSVRIGRTVRFDVAAVTRWLRDGGSLLPGATAPDGPELASPLTPTRENDA